MAGSDVSDAIDKDSGRMYSVGHAFCKAVDDAEGDITIGYSSASKVWSSAYKDLKDYIQWCDGLGNKGIFLAFICAGDQSGSGAGTHYADE